MPRISKLLHPFCHTLLHARRRCCAGQSKHVMLHLFRRFIIMQKQQHVVSFFAVRDPTHNHTSYVYIEASAVPAARTRPRSSSTIQATFFRRRRVIDLSSRINPIMFAMSRWHLPLPRTSTLLVASDAPKARRLGAILDGVGCSRRSALLLFPCQTCVSLCCCM